MAEIHTLAGDFSTALKFIEISLQIDPLSPSHYYTKANIFYLQNRISEALKVLDDGLAIIPTFTIALELRTACLMQLGQQEAFTASCSFYEAPFQDAIKSLYKLVQQDRQRNITEVNKIIANIDQVKNTPLLPWELYLMAYSGNLDEAIELLESKASKKSGQVINLQHDPLLKPLHGLKAFRELVRKFFPDNIILTVGKKRQRSKEFLTLEEAKQYANLLLAKMDEEKLYLTTDLGLKELAGKISLHPNKLSWLLNERIGQNFYDFVNTYRLKDFQKRAVEPKNQHLSILGLAYESGFNSKSVFNDYFKRNTGLTPKSWLRQQLEK